MAFKMTGAPEGHSDSLALFSLPAVDVATEKVEWVPYYPVNQYVPGTSLDFHLSGATTSYMDLKRSRLHVKLRLVDGSGKPISDKAKVGLVNLSLQSLWKQVEFSLQQQEMPGVVSNYPYKAIIDTYLNYGYQAVEGQFESQLYEKDTGSYIDDSTVSSNGGLVQRSIYTSQGKVVDLEGGLYLDLFQQNRYLLDGVQLTLKFWPSEESFRLMTDDVKAGYKVDILEATFLACMVKVSPEVIMGTAEALQKSPALYPYVRSDIKSFSIPSGQHGFTVDNLFQGCVPTRLIIGLIPAESFSGSYKRNPFNYKHYFVTSAGLYVNNQSVPSQPFKPDFEANNYVSCFLSLYTGFGKYMTDSGNQIDREDYAQGYTLYVFDLSSNHSPDYSSLVQKGHTRLEIKFGRPLIETAQLLCYAHFPGLMTIDQARNVQIKY
jgi:hypothetical protein